MKPTRRTGRTATSGENASTVEHRFPIIWNDKPRCCRHPLILVEDGVGQRDTFPAELQPAVRELIAVHVFARQFAGDLVLGKDDPQPVIGEGQLAADIALVAIAENVAQPVRFDIQRPVQVVRTARQPGKLRVVARHEAGKKGVGGFHVGNARQPQLLDQTICRVRLARSTRPLA